MTRSGFADPSRPMPGRPDEGLNGKTAPPQGGAGVPQIGRPQAVTSPVSRDTPPDTIVVGLNRVLSWIGDLAEAEELFKSGHLALDRVQHVKEALLRCVARG